MGGQPFGPVGHGDQEPTTRNTKAGKGGTNKNKNKKKQTKGGLVILISLPLISHSRHKPAVSTAERKGQLVLSLCMQMCAFV